MLTFGKQLGLYRVSRVSSKHVGREVLDVEIMAQKRIRGFGFKEMVWLLDVERFREVKTINPKPYTG